MQQRLRCNAHIINLVAKAILYGKDADCISDASNSATQIEGASLISDSKLCDEAARLDNDPVVLASLVH